MPTQSPPADAETPRLDNIEIKLAFAEDLLETLNRTVAQQAERIDALSREVMTIKMRQDSAERAMAADAISSVDGADGTDSANDQPPHY